MRKFPIREWATDDQPRKKLVRHGAHALSNTELLAILINNGTPHYSALDIARDLLKCVDNDLQRLALLGTRDMVKQDIKGFGEAKAVVIAAALELAVRRGGMLREKQVVFRASDVAGYLRDNLQYREQEVFAVVFLTGNRIIQMDHISEGGLTGTVADPRVILKKALQYNATALVLCHNHPSGNLTPSQADELLTQKIRNAASYLDIRVLDHIIVSSEGYFSFADEGLL